MSNTIVFNYSRGLIAQKLGVTLYMGSMKNSGCPEKYRGHSIPDIGLYMSI